MLGSNLAKPVGIPNKLPTQRIRYEVARGWPACIVSCDSKKSLYLGNTAVLTNDAEAGSDPLAIHSAEGIAPALLPLSQITVLGRYRRYPESEIKIQFNHIIHCGFFLFTCLSSCNVALSGKANSISERLYCSERLLYQKFSKTK